MIILGIDPGTATTGYGVIESENGDIKEVSHGCILTKSQEELEKRLDIIFDELTKLIKEFKPDMIAVEELFFASNAKTAISVGHARGVILLACSKAKVPVYEYTPLQVKQAICGYGRGEKQQIQKMVKTLLSLKEIPKPDDAADGLAIAICHANSVKSLKLQS
ncbi:crossover junction endodeoxyribonuclease RuvC [candidate division WS5 bacterium]|uniref:Crossover junction endodeoxyribonuclease RuvC n=1 Tax=candidate division WS5 bacterium TaxID=2093353 RepID=A0A419DG62_9BACT|nr:MAG: crossover junction endodeoxyribonuclease RuvC [candidate division WS5 bacterium]